MLFTDVSRKKVLDHRDLEIIAAEEHAKYMEQKRGRTAPARERRRNWIAESVDIKTDRGDKRRIRAPGITLTDNFMCINGEVKSVDF